MVGPPHGYGPVGPPPLPYHEAQMSLHDMPPCHGDVDDCDVVGCGNGDNRTLEWEAHAEALALGLGLLDDGADDPTCSVVDGSQHDAYLQHGPPPAAAVAEKEEAAAGADAGEAV